MEERDSKKTLPFKKYLNSIDAVMTSFSILFLYLVYTILAISSFYLLMDYFVIDTIDCIMVLFTGPTGDDIGMMSAWLRVFPKFTMGLMFLFFGLQLYASMLFESTRSSFVALLWVYHSYHRVKGNIHCEADVI